MEVALLTVLVLVLGSIWAAAGLFVVCMSRVEARTRRDLSQLARTLLEPPAEGQPSPLGIYSDQVATLFAARIMQQLKTAAAGMASGVAKEAQADAIGQLAGSSPWLGLLAGLLPKRFRNQLLSSPQFTGQLALGLGGNHQPAPGPSVAERLRKGG